MYENFHMLGEEKQTKIINAALNIFSQNPYSKASTDNIAAIAGISKGSLFFYFKNKRELYCYMYEYSCRKIYEKIYEQGVMEEKDFFEQNKKAIKARVCTMLEHPYIYDFSMRAYYETDKTVEEEIRLINEKMLKDIQTHFKDDSDTSKFRNPEDVFKALKMLIWISDGFLKERALEGNLDLLEIQRDFDDYIEILRRGFYKTECL